jgi:hypothetical protein
MGDELSTFLADEVATARTDPLLVVREGTEDEGPMGPLPRLVDPSLTVRVEGNRREGGSGGEAEDLLPRYFPAARREAERQEGPPTPDEGASVEERGVRLLREEAPELGSSEFMPVDPREVHPRRSSPKLGAEEPEEGLRGERPGGHSFSDVENDHEEDHEDREGDKPPKKSEEGAHGVFPGKVQVQSSGSKSGSIAFAFSIDPTTTPLTEIRPLWIITMTSVGRLGERGTSTVKRRARTPFRVVFVARTEWGGRAETMDKVYPVGRC